MRIRAALTGLTVVLAALTACTSSPESSNNDQPIEQNTVVTTLCDKYEEPTTSSAPAATPTTTPRRDTVITLTPTRVCDHSVKVEMVNGKRSVTCDTSRVGSVDLNVPTAGEKSTQKGFLGDWSVLDFVGFTRIEWNTQHAFEAHTVIVNGANWAYVDGPGTNAHNTASAPFGNTLNDSDWGGETFKLEVCGWGRG